MLRQQAITVRQFFEQIEKFQEGEEEEFIIRQEYRISNKARSPKIWNLEFVLRNFLPNKSQGRDGDVSKFSRDLFDAANLDVYSRMNNVLLNFFPDVGVRVSCHSFDPFKAKAPSPIARKPSRVVGEE